MRTKYFLMFLALLMSFAWYNETYAQNCLVFDYDSDGNRVSRIVDYDCNGRGDEDDVRELVDVGEIVVYPNPTEGCFTIVVPDGFEYTSQHFELYDVNGMLHVKADLYVGETFVDIGTLNTGVYLLKIYKGEEVFSKVILKR